MLTPGEAVATASTAGWPGYRPAAGFSPGAAALLVLQLGVLWACSQAGHALVEVLHLPLPGNVVGLLLLFAALHLGILPLRAVEAAGGLLLRHLSLLFIPYAVGIGEFAAVLGAHGGAIAAVLVVSAGVGFAVTGRVAEVGLSLSGERRQSVEVRHV
ncbi:MAG: CidA/LrgA family protein [Caldimonas sp.]